jgi:FkbM family methyltransferase
MVKQVAGIWLPNDETHLIPVIERTAAKSQSGVGSYQLQTLAEFMNFVPSDRRDTVVDVGAHVGLWSMHLSRLFKRVEAFEPTEVMQECFGLNVLNHPTKPCRNVVLHKVALSDFEGPVEISFERDNSGHTHVAPLSGEKIAGAAHLPAQAVTLDGYLANEFGLDRSIDAIKIDVEGYEPAVLRGAENTIRRHKPVICIEQKPHGFYGWEQYEAIKILMGWGAKPVHRVVDDFILIWE